MMKRCLSALVCLSMALMLLPMTALAAQRDGSIAGTWVTLPGVVGGDICFDAATGRITAADATITQAHIPDTINGVTVTSTGLKAFADNTRLTSVVLPSSLTTLGDHTFFGCTALRSITLCAGLQSIGQGAFVQCRALSSITLPASVQSITNDAFDECDALAAFYVDAPNAYFTAQDGVLFNDDCTTLIAYPRARRGAYTIPGTVTAIANNAFHGCASLTGLTIPDSVQYIGDDAFIYCSGLTRLHIPKSVVSIGYSFSYCSSLTAIDVDTLNPNYASADGVLFNKDHTTLILYPSRRAGAYTIPDTVMHIALFAFTNCAGLTDITIPNSVQTIELYAFVNCSGLTDVTLPASVQSIGEGAFYQCPELTAIHVAAGNSKYASSDGVVFNKAGTELLLCPNGRTGTYTIPDGVASIGTCAFLSCESLTDITIPNSVQEIGNNAFQECLSLARISIPGSVDDIGLSPFVECHALEEIVVENANSAYASIDGVLLDKACTTLIALPAGRQGIYTAPDTVTRIGPSSIAYCKDLTGVKLPASLAQIQAGAFVGCPRLKSVGFAGPAPSIDGAAFVIDRNSALTLYYIEGQANWTAPHYDRFKTALWDGQELPIPPDPPTVTSAGAFGPGEADHGIEYGLKGALIWLPDGRLQCTVDAARTKYVSTSIDNVPLEAGDVTLTEGSTIVTISAARVAKLKDGAHTLRVQFTDGRAEAAFTTPHNGEMLTANVVAVPATGGTPVGGTSVWAVLALLLIGVGMTKVKNEY